MRICKLLAGRWQHKGPGHDSRETMAWRWRGGAHGPAEGFVRSWFFANLCYQNLSSCRANLCKIRPWPWRIKTSDFVRSWQKMLADEHLSAEMFAEQFTVRGQTLTGTESESYWLCTMKFTDQPFRPFWLCSMAARLCNHTSSSKSWAAKTKPLSLIGNLNPENWNPWKSWKFSLCWTRILRPPSCVGTVKEVRKRGSSLTVCREPSWLILTPDFGFQAAIDSCFMFQASVSLFTKCFPFEDDLHFA